MEREKGSLLLTATQCSLRATKITASLVHQSVVVSEEDGPQLCQNAKV